MDKTIWMFNVLMLNIWLQSHRVLKFELCVAVKPRNCIVELLIFMLLPMPMGHIWDFLLVECTSTYYVQCASRIYIRLNLNRLFVRLNVSVAYRWLCVLLVWMTEYCFWYWLCCFEVSTNCTQNILRKYASLRVRVRVRICLHFIHFNELCVLINKRFLFVTEWQKKRTYLNEKHTFHIQSDPIGMVYIRYTLTWNA